MNSLNESKLTSFLNGTLTVAWYATWVIAIVFVIFMSFKGMPDFPITIELDDYHAGTLQLDNNSYEFDILEANGKMLIKNPPLFLRLTYIVFGLISFALTLLIIKTLRTIFSTIRKGEQFDIKNGLRIKNIANLLVVYQIFELLKYYVSFKGIVWHTHSEVYDLVYKVNIELYTIFFILVIYLLGHIFTVAAEMRDEQKLTV